MSGIMDAQPEIPPDTDEASQRSTEEFSVTAEQPSIPPTYTTETVTNQALNFLSTASNETLGACIVGLGAATYIVLGRVGLVLIGVVGGVALHASWEGSTHAHEEEKNAARRLDINRKREAGIEVLKRVLDWRLREGAKAGDIDEDGVAVEAAPDFFKFRPATANALNALCDAVIQNYVKWWYSPIIPTDSSFPSACRKTLVSLITSISANLSRKRPADTFLDFVTNSSSIVIVFFNELSVALSSSPDLLAEEAITSYLELNPQSSLANILDPVQQRRKLHIVADDVLEKFLTTDAYRCSPARLFLQQVFANVVLENTLQSCSRSEWINDWIIYLLGKEEPDLIHVIDNGIEAQQQSEQRTSFEMITEEGIVVHRDKEVLGLDVALIEEAHEEEEDHFEITEDGIVVDKRIRAGNAQSDGTLYGVQTPSSLQDDLASEEQPSFWSTKKATPTSAITSPSTFMSFDQNQDLEATAALGNERKELQPSSLLTLQKAKVAVFDDSEPEDNLPLRGKPNTEYLIQIEPALSHYGGWMIVRSFEDFESLHEVLRRISTVSGLSFTRAHANLPPWRGCSRIKLKDELERYLIDAVSYAPLAESEGMRRFLDKDRGSTKSPGSSGFAAAFGDMGKGMLDALTQAPKGVAGGGRAVIGGVASVMNGGARGNRRSIASPSPLTRFSFSVETKRGSFSANGGSQGGSRGPSSATSESPKQSMDYRRDSSLSRHVEARLREEPLKESERRRISAPTTPAKPGRPVVDLPPPPSDIDDDYFSPAMGSWPATPRNELEEPRMSVEQSAFETTANPWTDGSSDTKPSFPPRSINTASKQNMPAMRAYASMSEQEAQVMVELLFAVINALYTLSSAWNIRRTLLTAAKTFLVRSGNPQLESIRALLQESVLDANTSDEGIAAHILKLRANALPTEEELKAWPSPPSEEQKTALRVKARKLLVEKGMPQALTSVMGGAASGEALGKVFDCLQVKEVARGLMYALILQVVRAVAQ